MRFFITSIFWACTLLVGLTIIAPQPAAAQSATFVNETREIGVWAQKFNNLQIEMIGFVEAPEFTALLNSFEIDDDEVIEEKYKVWKQDVKRRTAQLNSSIARMPETPNLVSPEFKGMNGVFRAQADSIDESFQDFMAVIDSIDKLVVGALQGEEENVTELEVILLNSAKSMLESENTMMQVSSKLMPDKDHPSIFLLQMVIEINVISILSVDVDLLSIDEKTTLADRKGIIDDMQASMKRALKAKARAYRNTSKYKKQIDLARLTTLNKQEKEIYKKVANMFENFKRGIDNESNILDILQKQIDIYAQDMDYWDIEAEITALDDETYPYVDRRLQLQNERTIMVQNLQ